MITYGKNTFPPVGGISCFEELIVTFGNYCSIASGLKIVSGEHPVVAYPQVVSQYPFHEHWGVEYPPSKMDGVVVVGHDVWIGEDVTIIEGVTLGSGAIIGAKSVVARNVPDYAIVVGNPAKITKYRFYDYEKDVLKRVKWWDWDEEKVREAMPFMKDVNEFIAKYG